MVALLRTSASYCNIYEVFRTFRTCRLLPKQKFSVWLAHHYLKTQFHVLQHTGIRFEHPIPTPPGTFFTTLPVPVRTSGNACEGAPLWLALVRCRCDTEPVRCIQASATRNVHRVIEAQPKVWFPFSRLGYFA